ncbi:hypothetical protein C4F40_18500 [Sphingobacterium sp. Ka21]|uniref:Uncharacterized protein n=2 Tax=Sphingobacterium pedocola TaxID=2082722 RepID=A0ABR9TBK3_9SPHI|nr:hypothetical protein [Sphingobacterium pedocola]
MFSFASCKKEKVNGEKRVKNLSTIDIGLRIPELRDTRNDTIRLVLYPSAMFYFVDAGLTQSENNIKLFKKAIKQRLPVRVMVYEDNQLEVAAVYPATEEDLARFRESSLHNDN